MSRWPLTVAALELPHRFGEVAANLQLVETMLANAGRVDLALLPEAALTGYVSPQWNFDLTSLAEPLDGPTRRQLAALAQRHRVHLAAPLIEGEGAALYNSLLVLNPSGDLIGHYRKRCPWYPERWATPGNLGTPLIEVNGWKLAPAICFDIHFVAEFASDALADADALLFPSAWVEEEPGEDSRCEILTNLVQEFDLAIVNANWGEGVPRVPGQGCSRILDRHGVELRRAASASVIVTTLQD